MTNCTISRKGRNLGPPITMNKAAIKAAILASMPAKLDQWLVSRQPSAVAMNMKANL